MDSPTGTSRLVTGLHLGVLFVLAVSQPVLDLLGRNVEFLVAHRAGPPDVVALVVVWLVVLPLVPGLTLLAVSPLGGRARRSVTSGWLVLLGALVVLRIWKLGFGAVDAAAVAVAVAAGGLLAWGHPRSETLRWGLTVVSPAILVVGGVFLATPAVWSTVLPDDDRAVALPESAIRSPIAIVVFDALSLGALLDENGAVDAGRYPHFAALARQASFFPGATAVSDSTTRSIPALLTGRRPQPDAQPRYADHPESLFTLLGATHRLHVLETDTHLCPDWLCAAPGEGATASLGAMLADLSVVYAHLVVPNGLGERLPSIGDRWRGFGGPAPSPRTPPHGPLLDGFLEGMTAGDEPGLFYLHVYAPHTPYYYLPSGHSYRTHGQEASGQGEQWNEWGEDEWAVLQSQQRYLLQVGYADSVLGRFVDRLRELGLYDETLLIVTADHGTSFWPGRARRRLSAATARDIASVPLLIKQPHQQEARVDPRPVELIDVLPSLFDALGAPLLVRVDGRSVFGAAAARRPRRIVGGAGGAMRLADDRFAGPDPSVERMHAHFGAGDWQGVLRLGPRPDLVDRTVDSLPVERDVEVGIRLLDPDLYAAVDPESGFVPAEVVGIVTPPATVDLAIAVDGVVAATTRSYAETGAFSAIVDESRLTRGRHRVDAYRIRGEGGETVLVAGAPDSGHAGFVGLRLGNRTVLGVAEQGFYPARPGELGRSRWTTGRAELRVPLGSADRPDALEVELSAKGRPEARVVVRVDGCRLAARNVGVETWRARLPLAACPLSGEALRIEIQSDAHRTESAPLGTIERLGLGVRVHGITLRAHSPEARPAS